MCTLLTDGRLNMMHVKNVVHGLRVKWFQQLCADCGSSWSKFIWPILTALIPPELLQGLRSVSEKILNLLPPSMLVWFDHMHIPITCFMRHSTNLNCLKIYGVERSIHMWTGTG